jgi:FkbM family methyltransferase
MRIGRRDLARIWTAPLQMRHYVAGTNMVAVYAHPVDIFTRYINGSGEYPTTIEVKTPTGPLQLTLYSHHDLLTVNEIFCRKDYGAEDPGRVIVDFGSNIGISAAYFLSRNPNSFAYLFEPVARNVQRLNANLMRFKGRYHLSPVAVALEPGVVSFGCENTGRYGGIGKMTNDTIQVEAVSANEVLRSIIASHRQIDTLKIDIETLEKQVVEHLPLDLVARIKTCYVEYRFDRNPLDQTHRMKQYCAVAQFRPVKN